MPDEPRRPNLAEAVGQLLGETQRVLDLTASEGDEGLRIMGSASQSAPSGVAAAGSEGDEPSATAALPLESHAP